MKTNSYQTKHEIIVTMKIKCHIRFDNYWRSHLVCENKKHVRKIRGEAYRKLAQEMEVSPYESHFKNMNDTKTLLKAYRIILSWDKN